MRSTCSSSTSGGAHSPASRSSIRRPSWSSFLKSSRARSAGQMGLATAATGRLRLTALTAAASPAALP